MDYVERLCPCDRTERTTRDALSLCPSIASRISFYPVGGSGGSSPAVSASRSDLAILLCDAVLSGAVVAWLKCCECWPVWQRANDTVLCVCIVWVVG